MSAQMAQARTFAASVAGVLDRQRPGAVTTWSPGELERGVAEWDGLTKALDKLDWVALSTDPELVNWAGLAGIELGRRCAPLAQLDRLLDAAPLVDGMIRSAVPQGMCVTQVDRVLVERLVVTSERLPAADGLDVHRVIALGDPVAIDAERWKAAWATWLSASVGYLAGLGAGALDMTVDYVRGRTAFGGTLGALSPVQQLLAGAATAVTGITELAGSAADMDALIYAGTAAKQACAACHQVSGGIGYTREYPLHGFTQRARALTVWNESIIERYAV